LELRIAERTRDLAQANERLRSLSLTDGLTGIANRRSFDETLDLEWRRSLRHAKPLTVAFIDVDWFKLTTIITAMWPGMRSCAR
jgi:PleD family two-component response regulator